MKRFLTTNSNISKKLAQENIDEPCNKYIPPSTSTEIDKISNHYLFDGKFYQIISITDNKLTARCQLCFKTIQGQINSTGNFLSHIKFIHPSILSKVKESKIILKKTRKNNVTLTPSKQMTLPYFQGNITKQHISQLVFDYIVEEMKPLVTSEKPAFRRIIQGLTGITDTALLPNRKTISCELKLKYKNYVFMLTNLIKKQNYICNTADIWSANNKSFMGMTCHFIDENSYERYSYVLGCRRIKGSHDFLNIANVINDICETYQIDNSKITHIITDNASNFGKAFRTFSNSSTVPSDTNYIGNFCSDTDTELENSFSNSDSENDMNPYNIEYIDVHSLLSESNSNNPEYNNICLPNHITCCAHTLNLIATTDIEKISDTKYINISKQTFNKLHAFWNLISRSTVASDKVFDHCKVKFPVPIITRWNSMFLAVKKILTFKNKLLCVFEDLKLTKLKMAEWIFLEEYSKIMEPLAIALDKLQEEKRCFLGYVAPTIIVLRRLLIQSTHLVHCRPLSLCIISSLEKRFDYLFNLSAPKSKDFIIASMSHPKFKCNWIPVRYIDLCKQLFINECKTMTSNSDNTEHASSDDNSDDSSDTEFYNIVSLSENNVLNYEVSDSNNTEVAVRSCNLTNVQALSFLNSKKKDLNVLDLFPIVKKVFIKFNTSIPSSAPVERLFSGAIQVLTPRRNRLCDKTFEMLLCCKCEMQKNR